MLARDAEWIWDSWYVVDGDDLHSFYLMAPKSLGDPALRHVNARVGHSVSKNGRDWTHLPEALGPSEGDGFDSQAIWTGSVVKQDGLWHLFYTGICRETKERVQAVGHATSTDLITWSRAHEGPVLRASAPYADTTTAADGAENFRDPWVFFHGGTWNMLLTANEPSGWGTVAHATSPDLETWALQPALIDSSEFRQLEVTETLEVNGTWSLLFCMGPDDVHREGVPREFGTYCVPADGPLGPFHLDRTELLAAGVYAARAVYFQDNWLLLGFLDTGTSDGFQGVICDPVRLRATRRGTLETAP